MFNKTCLVVYIGNGYSENSPSYDNAYTYSVDMRDNKANHHRCIYRPLQKLGYKIDTALVTNKHKHYDEFVKEYNAIPIGYDDVSQSDLKLMTKIFELKIPERWGPGNFRSGGRFLKLHHKFPDHYDQYVFVRADAHFKMKLDEFKIDENKMNYLWAETDFRYHTEMRQKFLDNLGPESWFWDTYNRVAGNVLSVVPKKYINVFLSYYWLEHLSLHGMLKDLSPLITVENDVNIMMGLDNFFVTDIRYTENPVYTFNKKNKKPA